MVKNYILLKQNKKGKKLCKNNCMMNDVSKLYLFVFIFSVPSIRRLQQFIKMQE